MNSNQIKNSYSSIEQMTEMLKSSKQSPSSLQNKTGSKTFSEVLDSLQSSKELVFSKHANERMQSRNIDLSDNQLERLQSGAKKAGEKGIKESLVMIDNLAFIVNVRNNTVITAVNDSDDKVFTNIDGAVIA